MANKFPEGTAARRISLEKSLGILTPQEEAWERDWEICLAHAKNDEEEQKILNETIRAIWGWSQLLDRFPGNVAEYNAVRGEQHEIISFEGKFPIVHVDIYRTQDWYLLDHLMKSGVCVGLVHYVPPQVIEIHVDSHSQFTAIGGYGVPVRKAQQK
ncbi:hypothetical protein HYS49_02175 [Candidatus Woesearchaeota archaeon]|nr:hypothetical protein [Candidatus Woesearchaeota archaeon]